VPGRAWTPSPTASGSRSRGRTGHGKSTLLNLLNLLSGLDRPTWRERGLTLVLVSHDAAIARRAQRTAVMTRGRLTFRT
jgi:ABC-type lipoprotein export system ATPase subunit